MATSSAPPLPGQVFVLPETEYRYGVGPVVAHVTDVVNCVDYRGEQWWHISGMVANGTPEHHGGWQDRQLYIRWASFPQTRQVPIV